jgi:hypothetical protein
VFSCAWLGGWAIGEISALTLFLPLGIGEGTSIIVFVVFWLIGWTIGGTVVILIVAWNLVGKEVIILSADILKIELRILMLKRTKRYLPTNIKNFRLLATGEGQLMFNLFQREFWGFNGNIAFDYGMKTIKFSKGIDEAEASYIINLLKRRISA